jgi:uncharacterized surface protein with fasciclin (FAS1) repeats
MIARDSSSITSLSQILSNQLFSIVNSLLASNPGVLAAIENGSNLTINVPTNKAFDNIQDMLSMISPEQLTNILSYHVAQGQIKTPIAKNFCTLLNGSPMILSARFINNKVEIEKTYKLSNGNIVNIIQSVLIPFSYNSPTCSQ